MHSTLYGVSAILILRIPLFILGCEIGHSGAIIAR